jgi:hypothetical protein
MGEWRLGRPNMRTAYGIWWQFGAELSGACEMRPLLI